MTKRKLQLTWKPDNKAEVAVPLLVLTMLRVSRILGAVPVRLRRARMWQISLSPPLFKLQRLVATITSISAIIGAVLNAMRESNEFSTRNTLLSVFELALVISAYTLAIWTAPGRLKHVTSLLRQMQKIKTSIHGIPTTKTEIAYLRLLLVYIIWGIIINVEVFTWDLHNAVLKGRESVTIVCLYAGFDYQFIVGMMLRIHWSLTIMELKSTLTLLNDHLEHYLLNTKEPDFDIEHIHHFNDCNEMISNMIAQINMSDGPFLLLSFMMVFLNLLITLYNLFLAIGTFDPVNYNVLRQSNWLLVHFSQLLMLVEPCHRLQNQLDRARSLLGKAVGTAGCCGYDSELLEMFVLQMKMRSAVISPMGVFTVARSLVASVIGGVATYLIIFYQFQTVSYMN